MLRVELREAEVAAHGREANVAGIGVGEDDLPDGGHLPERACPNEPVAGNHDVDEGDGGDATVAQDLQPGVRPDGNIRIADSAGDDARSQASDGGLAPLGEDI